MRKRILSFLMILAILCSFLVLPIVSAEVPTFSVTVTGVRRGNIYRYDEEKKFHIVYNTSSKEEEKITATYHAKTARGVELLDKLENITLKEVYETDLVIDMDVFDVATLSITLTGENIEEPIEKIVEFSNVNAADAQNLLLGINTHVTVGGYNPDYYEWCVELYKMLGYGRSRDWEEWFRIERSAGGMALQANHDYYYRREKEIGMEPLIVLGLGNSIYTGAVNGQHAAPYTDAQRKAFTDYAKFLATSYKDYVKDYEVWNEWNHVGSGFNPESRGPDVYAELLKATYTELKNLNPDLNIIGVATGGTAASFTKGVIDAGGCDYMDYASAHPYQFNSIPEGGTENSIREWQKMFEGTKVKPTYMTEYGWSNKDDPKDRARSKTLEQVAKYTVRSFALFQAYDLGINYYFELVDSGTRPNVLDDNFGHVKQGTYYAKPSFLAVANYNHFIAKSKFQKIYQPVGTDYFSHYKMDDNRDVVMAWTSEEEAVKQYTLKSNSPVEVFDLYGNSLGEVEPIGNAVPVSISSRPVYIVGEFGNPEISRDSAVSTYGTDFSMCRDDILPYELSTGITDAKLEIECSSGVNAEVVDAENGKYRANITTNSSIEKEGWFTAKLIKGDKVVFTEQRKISISTDYLTIGASVELADKSGKNTNRWKMQVSIKNGTHSRAFSGKCYVKEPEALRQVEYPDHFKDLEPGETRVVTINLPEIVRKEPYKITTVVELDNGDSFEYTNTYYFSVMGYANKKPVIDGKREIGEWNGTTCYYKSNSYSNEDVSGCFTTMYDEDYFYLVAEVTDNVFYAKQNDFYQFMNDSIQIGVEDCFARNESHQNFDLALRTELGISKTPKGDQVYQFAHIQNLNETKDITDVCEVSINRVSDVTTYEVKIPWENLVKYPELITENYDIGFAMVINDNDGSGRKYIEYASGIAGVKSASDFSRMFVEKSK